MDENVSETGRRSSGRGKTTWASESFVREPPKAPKVPKELVCHGDVRVDDYYWLRKRDDPRVLAYLEAENAYTEAVMAPTRGLREALFEEIKQRIQEDDSTVPYRLGDYFYYRREEAGRQYSIYCRKKGSLNAPEELVLDVNEVAAGHDFCQVPRIAVSYGQDLIAYPVDTVGRRFYTLRFRNLATGETLADEIPSVTATLAWANDNRTIFYAKQDPVTLRVYRIYRHVLGTDAANDVLVYEEQDPTFMCFVHRTRSKRYLMITSHQTVTTECQVLEADNPEGRFRLLVPRERGHEYMADHFDGYFYIRTNFEAKNFRLVRMGVQEAGLESWEEVVAHRDEVFIDEFDLFRDHLVVSERREGLLRLSIRRLSDGEEHEVAFDEPAYTVHTADNYDFDTDVLRFRYTSLATPLSTYDYDMSKREMVLLKQEKVLGGFERDRYETERVWARAEDGTSIPISLLYRKDQRLPGGNPLLLYGYGAYGSSRDPVFSSARLSLLDRGFVYGLAHIRGGQELGRGWYESGRTFKKKNTFTDFISCGEHLVETGWADPGRLYAEGGSAGGLLVGAVINLRPDLFKAVIAKVPFVDVLTTMLDESMPLTTAEYDEWGDPRRKEIYDYIRSYSPYDNVEAKEYPHLLVTTGIHDSQVQYWEPAKWVAKLRTKKTDTHRLLLKTDLGAGHAGPSGRYDRYREVAFDYAFLLDLAGLAGSEP